MYSRYDYHYNYAMYSRHDYRLKYLNLKMARSQNALSIEDVHKLWIPFLVFDNTEKNEATKVGENNDTIYTSQQCFLGHRGH